MKILTDDEHRIFLAAMAREMDYCKKIDKEINGCKDLVPICRSIIDKVDNAEPVRHGEWIDKPTIQEFAGRNIPVVECSKCGIAFCDLINNHRYMYHYCPNCGAEMDKEMRNE